MNRRSSAPPASRRRAPRTPRRRGPSGHRRALPQSRVYQLLEPGPVVLLATARGEHMNVMTQSWHTMLEFEPPLVACVISDRNHSYAALRATRECTLNIPTLELAGATVGCGNTSGRRVDKFRRFHLTPLPAAKVRAPLIAECYAGLECIVRDATLAARYGLFVLEVVKAWVDPTIANPRTLHHRGYGRFMVAGRTVELRSRMR